MRRKCCSCPSLQAYRLHRIARRSGIPTSGLAPPINSRTLLQEYDHIFEDQWHARTVEPELWSPFYDGREDENDDPFPFVVAEHLRVLLQIIQSLVKISLQWKDSTPYHATVYQTILQSLFRRIFSMPSAKLPNMPCSNDFVYEAIRLTSILLIRSLKSNGHPRSLAAGTSIVQEIRVALEKTNLNGLWDKHIGLLYLVILVYQSAAFGTPDYLFGHVLILRLHFTLTYSYNDWHATVQPMAVIHDLLPLENPPLRESSEGLEMMTGYRENLAEIQTTVVSTLPALVPDIESSG